MTDYSDLKAAALAATQGLWVARADGWTIRAYPDNRIASDGIKVVHTCSAHMQGQGSEPDVEQQVANQHYIEQAQPAAVLGLINELSVALLQLDIQRGIAARRYEEIEKLKAENEALRKDAERYQWLRSRESSEDPEISVTQWTQLSSDRAMGAAPRLEGLDAVVDLAMSKERRA